MGRQSAGSHLVTEGVGEEKTFCSSLKTQGAWWLMGGKEVSDVRILQEWSQFMGKLALGFRGCGRLIKQQGSCERLLKIEVYTNLMTFLS